MATNNTKLTGAEFFRKYSDIVTEAEEPGVDNNAYWKAKLAGKDLPDKEDPQCKNCGEKKVPKTHAQMTASLGWACPNCDENPLTKRIYSRDGTVVVGMEVQPRLPTRNGPL